MADDRDCNLRPSPEGLTLSPKGIQTMTQTKPKKKSILIQDEETISLLEQIQAEQMKKLGDPNGLKPPLTWVARSLIQKGAKDQLSI